MINPREMVKARKLLEEKGFLFLEEYGDGLTNHFNINKKNNTIIIKKENYEEYKQIENNYIPNLIKELEHEFVNTLTNMNNGYLPSQEIENLIKSKIPKGYKRSVKFVDWYAKHGYKKVPRINNYKKLSEIGINVDNKHNTIVISDDTYEKIKSNK